MTVAKPDVSHLRMRRRAVRHAAVLRYGWIAALALMAALVIGLTAGAARSMGRGLILFGAHHDDYVYRLYVLDMSTGETIQLMEDERVPLSKGVSSWSPDGAVAFTSTQESASSIYVWTPNQVRDLTPEDGYDYFPLWSPDGDSIAFVSHRAGSTDLYAMNAEGGDQRMIGQFYGESWDMVWSPDGAKLAFRGWTGSYGDLFIADMASGDVRRITDNAVDDNMPDWSRDGTRLVWSSSDYQSRNVMMVDLRTGETRDLTQHDSLNAYPVWSPDGTQIAFVSSRGGVGSDLYVMNPDGSQVRRVTRWDGSVSFPAWSPDGSELLFVSDRDGRLDLYTVNLASSEIQRLTALGTLDMNWPPQWLP